MGIYSFVMFLGKLEKEIGFVGIVEWEVGKVGFKFFIIFVVLLVEYSLYFWGYF